MSQSTASDHYGRNGLTDSILDGLVRAGKSLDTVSVDDLAPVDEFHIGGRQATEELMGQLKPSACDRLLDVGCGIGGAARFAASRYKAKVTGIDLTLHYVNAGNVLCQWVGLDDQVSLIHASALAVPLPDESFDGGYMLHVGMNIEDKPALFAEVARLLKPSARFAIYDVMRVGEGELEFPLPWASSPSFSSVSWPKDYRGALLAAGFEILAERNRREFALGYFTEQRERLSKGHSSPVGLHILMGDKREAQVRNMSANILSGRIAPFEMIVRKL